MGFCSESWKNVPLRVAKPNVHKISVVIITFNEERNIGRCIDSVRAVADEIVIVDSYSSDRTKDICLSKQVRFFEHPFNSHIDQKSFALSLATYDRVLSLDADEYLSEELLHSIQAVKQTWPYNAYRMNRLSNYGGKWIRRGNWYPDRKVRLWDRTIGTWGGENPHDRVKLKKGVKVKQLKGDLYHRGYQDSTETLEKIQRYSEIFSRELIGKRAISPFMILLKTSFAFAKSLFLKRGILDGFEGLMVAFAVANHTAYKYAKLYEYSHREAIGDTVIFSRTDNLGDVILSLPLIGYLKKVRPNTKIYFVGKQYTRAIIENCAHVDGFLDREELIKNPKELNKLEAQTIIYIYPDQQLSRAVDKHANIPNRVATAHRWYNWLYCNHLVGFSRFHSDQHEVQLNFNLLKPFKLYEDVHMPLLAGYYGLKTPHYDWASLLSADKANIVIHPKLKSAQCWPLSNYQQLIKLISPTRARIFITGLKKEGESIEKEIPGFFSQPGVVDMTGKCTLDELISFISQTDIVVAGNTGVLHLAASLGIHTLGLYSPRRPIHPGRWMPLGKQASYIARNKDCNDCKNKPECPCISSISPDEVMQVIDLKINESRKRKLTSAEG